MTGLTVIFRTPSQIEADVVRGLLETHGIQSALARDLRVELGEDRERETVDHVTTLGTRSS